MPPGGCDLTQKLYVTMEKHKEVMCNVTVDFIGEAVNNYLRCGSTGDSTTCHAYCGCAHVRMMPNI